MTRAVREWAMVYLVHQWSVRRGLTVAEHESVHAVLAHRLGFPVGLASIVPANEIAGFILLKAHDQLTPADQVSCLKRDSKGVPIDDVRHAARVLVATNPLNIGWKDLLRQVQTFRDAAIEMVRDPLNWCAVKRLSVELQEHRTLTGAEILHCLNRSDESCAAGDYSWPLTQTSGPAFPFVRYVSTPAEKEIQI